MLNTTIINKAESTKIFGEVLPGESFEWCGRFYIKMESQNSPRAFMPDNGMTTVFHEDEAVYPCIATISYKYI